MGLKIPVSLVRFRVRAPLFLTLAFGGGFFVLGNGLSIELRSIIRRRRLTPSGPAQALFKNAPGVFVRVRAPLFLTLAFGGGFFVPGNGLSIELRSIIRRRRLALLLPSRLSISLEQLPTFKKPQYCCVFICAKYSGCFFAQVQRCFLYIIYRPRPWTIDTKKNSLTP